MSNKTCDYCHDVGACPKCWGRSAIEELKAQNADMLEAMIFVAASDSFARLNGICQAKIRAAIAKAEGREP